MKWSVDFSIRLRADVLQWHLCSSSAICLQVDFFDGPLCSDPSARALLDPGPEKSLDLLVQARLDVGPVSDADTQGVAL